MSRIASAFRSFFAILFSGALPEDIASTFGYVKKKAEPPKPKFVPTAADGALQLLGILQRDARLLDFFLEDITPYSDEEVGSAVRDVHAKCRAALTRYVELAPVIDGVEGTFTKLDTVNPAAVKLLGNVPAKGKAAGGVLRHKGWQARKIDLPAIPGPDATAILAPAELEVE